MNSKRFEIKKIVFLCLVIGLGLFPCKSVFAQKVGNTDPKKSQTPSTDRFKVFKRKVLLYTMVDANEDYAKNIDYVEIQWSRETVNPLEKYLAENRKNLSADVISYYEKQIDTIREIGLENLWRLKMTFKYKNQPENGILELSYGYNNSYNDKEGNFNDSVEWGLFPDITFGNGFLQFGDYYWKNISWYYFGDIDTYWEAHSFQINPFTMYYNSKDGIYYGPSYPKNGQNILKITSYTISLDIDLSIIIELDGSFFP
ncbi:hypothetical protein [Treponema sp. R80B11-R83G3]